MVVVILVMIISLLSIAIVQLFKNRKSEIQADFKSFIAPRLLFFTALMITCDLICGGELYARLLFDLMLALMFMLILSGSLKNYDYGCVLFNYCCMLQSVISVYYILCSLRLFAVLPEKYFLALACIAALSAVAVFYVDIWQKTGEIKAIMKCGTVWAFVCLCVDFIYVSFPLVVLVLFLCAGHLFPGTGYVRYFPVFFLMFAELVALALRIVFDSRFVILQKHENLIVESMKISQIDMFGNSKDDEQYKEIYERVVLLFEMDKPFLKGELTINDIVKVVFSNKVYISRAISHYTGRNFRQFVNYHRVMYSMDLFRSRPELKVAELSALSGFNTVVSYTMAFRLFVNETPSEWCRKERTKLLKTKN